MMRYSLSQHPIIGRVFAYHSNARGVGFADDLNIYASLKTAHKVLVEMRQRLGEDAKRSFNMTKVKIYISRYHHCNGPEMRGCGHWHTRICQRVRALKGPCHRARCSKASHLPGPKNPL